MLQPKLRFSEFKRDWEIQKLGGISTFINGKAFNQSELKESGKYPILRVGNLFTNNHWYYSDLELDGSKYIDCGDLIYAWSATFGPRIWNDGKVIYHYHIWKVECGYSINKLFYYHLLDNETLRMKNNSSNGFALLHITKGTIENWTSSFPTLPEQTKIASFLSTVDEKINLLKKQLTLLEQYKKGVMQKIFSREIRFKDDDGTEFPEWEIKKLGEIGSFQTSSIDKLSNPDEQEVYLVNYMNVYRHEELNNKTVKDFQIVTAKENQIKSCNLIKGDILFTPSSETPGDIGHSVVIFENLETAVFSYHLMRWRPIIQIDLLYSHYFCNTNQVLTQISRLATGSTRFTISVKSFSSIIVGLPVLHEQQKIASFLSSIDHKIDKNKDQIRKMELWKKGLLQQMFI
jgi:type I restriction enzyme S subunit